MKKYLTVLQNKQEITLDTDTVLYIHMERNTAKIHTSDNKVYVLRITLRELEKQLGRDYIKVHRSCLVSARAIHDISDKIYLNNGEALEYVVRKKKELTAQLHELQKNMISSFGSDSIPSTSEEYQSYYKSFDTLPFAFTDIEMIFDEERRAVDWIFRYGNPALAKLEKLPLEKLIGNSFSGLFSNMDSKWLKSYERATLYGEIREIIDYSPEIDTYLKVICFPTFRGHCGCILFNIKDIEFTKNSSDAERALMLYLGKLPEQK